MLYKTLQKYFVNYKYAFLFLSQYILGINDAHSVLRKFLATESSLKMVKYAFYFTLKAIFILKFLS